MRALVTCEHASGELPAGIDLGLAREVMLSHVSCDRGSEEIARALAAQLSLQHPESSPAPLHLGRFSRLLVDLNRREENPAVIVAETYGVAVPGNAGLSTDAREARIERWHRPYRRAALEDATALAATGGCLHLSIHSFDPAVDPPTRQFAVGVLFDTEREPEASLAARLADGLAASGLSVRLNEPYAGVPEGLTSWLRAQIPASHYSGIEIEASQGWMDEPAALPGFTARLAAAVAALLG